jgi:hypothetical protein
VVDELGQIFESSGVVVVAHYEGLTVAEMQDLRGRMRAVGGSVRVAKNKLAKIALEGKPCASIASLLTGMTVLAFPKIPSPRRRFRRPLPRTTRSWKILGGAMGSAALTPDGVKAVASDAVARGAYRSGRGVHRRPCLERWPVPLARLLRTSRASSPPWRSGKPPEQSSACRRMPRAGTHLIRMERNNG